MADLGNYPIMQKMPEKTTTQVQRLYENYPVGDSIYGNYFKEHLAIKEHYALLDEFCRLIKPNHRVYDIGCGTGHIIRILFSCGVSPKQLTGLDLAEVNIKRLKKEGIKAIRGDVNKLNIKSNSADFVICNGVIHHTKDPEIGFKELLRICKKMRLYI